ncbi:phenylalanine-4-hydroxylase [Monoraphidium neglectum]|uniref:phenylalanine 4-monooxygenase n=1 Tax=Monoraphidium neglectum TaxID=145388 RepID=A0A0D2MT76_9CHLO|nr:phenylalanine-4-hydroxylase [Monoraphidium neglectum]KIZ03637.1 phenylalanine-4-hydroxylase [Monoraphidium neglectum]|eukprot:XP_013902656.1 phenylalanine-4-hydroxylase [Monoraphidium neglectum]
MPSWDSPVGAPATSAAHSRSGDSPLTSSKAAVVAAVPAPAAAVPGLIRVPSSIHEVDNGKILGFGADLAEDHPGFGDEAYKQRRAAIADIARRHEIGDPIPRIDYTPDEVRAWGTALRELKLLFPTAACREFLHTFPMEDEIPQLQDISDILTATSGWKVRPVAGLMHPRDFLNGLAFKYFHSTQYVRHHSQPNYTPEPDVVHELIGHVPMLADPDFARMVQAIGVASLGAEEKTIWHLTKVYWYTVEFGVVREGGAVKAFGAGVLSSYGELDWMARGGAELAPFDPYAKQPKMSYKDGFQRK